MRLEGGGDAERGGGIDLVSDDEMHVESDKDKESESQTGGGGGGGQGGELVNLRASFEHGDSIERHTDRSLNDFSPTYVDAGGQGGADGGQGVAAKRTVSKGGEGGVGAREGEPAGGKQVQIGALVVGVRVKIHSLEEETELNGVEGEVLDLNARTGRWRVKTDPDSRVVAIEAFHLTVLAAGVEERRKESLFGRLGRFSLDFGRTKHNQSQHACVEVKADKEGRRGGRFSLEFGRTKPLQGRQVDEACGHGVGVTGAESLGSSVSDTCTYSLSESLQSQGLNASLF